MLETRIGPAIGIEGRPRTVDTVNKQVDLAWSAANRAGTPSVVSVIRPLSPHDAALLAVVMVDSEA